MNGTSRTGCVSVIIPVLDDPDRLALALRALAGQTVAAGIEVWVVDNGPSEAVRRVVAACPIARYLSEPRRGSYAARNTGLAAARHDVIAFTDADCLPAADWIARGLAAVSAAADIGLVGGRIDVVPADPARPTAVELFEIVAGLRQDLYVNRWGFAATANVFTRRRVIDDVGAFRADLQSGGDHEWSRRVAAAGYRLVYDDAVRITHPARRTWRELRRKTVRVAGGLHDLRGPRQPWRRLARDCVDEWPGVRDVTGMLRDARLRSVSDRLRVVAAAAAVRSFSAMERIRRRAGGTRWGEAEVGDAQP